MSASYWEHRYATGGNSGDGSAGDLARFKADFLNGFVREHTVASVVEFGCGDGRQLELAEYPVYLGLDVSATALQLCRERFAGDETKTFRMIRPLIQRAADLALSLDVVYHLTEDGVYAEHLRDVFAAGRRFVILYATDSERLGEEWTAPHVRHRPIELDVAAWFPSWELRLHRENPYPGRGGSDFYVYEPC